MSRLKRQIGYDRTQKKPIYTELTYEYFSSHLYDEWCFVYHDLVIDIAHHFSNGVDVLELNVNDKEQKNIVRYEFLTSDQLLNEGKINGKMIKEIWGELNK